MNTCSFNYSTSVVQSCCKTANMSISAGSTIVTCGVADDAMESFGRCLATNGVYQQLCVTNSRDARPSSSARRTTTLGPLPLLLLFLACFAAVVHAEPTPRRIHPRASPPQQLPNCTRFDMDKDRDHWLTNATTARRPVSDKLSCTAALAPCALEANVAAVFTLQFLPPANATAEIDASSAAGIVKAVGGSYNASATSSLGKGFYLPSGVSGYVEAFALAAAVPGVFRQCSDGGEYAGSVIVPDSARVARRVVFE